MGLEFITRSLSQSIMTLIAVIFSFMLYFTDKQEAFEKCWAHSPLRAAARRCPQQQQQQRQRQRQRVTEGTATASQNGPNEQAYKQDAS